MLELSSLPSQPSLAAAIERAYHLINRSASKLFPPFEDATVIVHYSSDDEESEPSDEGSEVDRELQCEQVTNGSQQEHGEAELMPQSKICLAFEDIQTQRRDLLAELDACRSEVYFLLGDITVLAAEIEEENTKWSKMATSVDRYGPRFLKRKRNPEAIVPSESQWGMRKTFPPTSSLKHEIDVAQHAVERKRPRTVAKSIERGILAAEGTIAGVAATPHHHAVATRRNRAHRRASKLQSSE